MCQPFNSLAIPLKIYRTNNNNKVLSCCVHIIVTKIVTFRNVTNTVMRNVVACWYFVTYYGWTMDNFISELL